MKTRSALLLVCALAIPVIAQDAATKAAQPQTSGKGTPAALTIPASAAVVNAPLVLKDGAISTPQHTELAEGGKAVFSLTIENAGDYLIHAVVDAPGEDANSFFVNVDAPPEDPLMIWDMDVTNGFQERIVSWRGNGDANYDEFSPKVFKLTAGEHKLIIVGREPATLLKSVSIRPVSPAPAEGSLAFLQKRYEEADANCDREVRKLTDTPEGQAKAEELSKRLDADHAEQFLAAIKLAEANPRSKTGFSALEWVLKIVRSYHLPGGPRALALMNEQYAQEPEISSMLATLTWNFPFPRSPCYQSALNLLNSVVAKNPDRTARGHATIGLAWLAKRKFQEAEYKGDPAELGWITEETVKVFESVIRDYGDCPNLREGATAKATLGSLAESELHEIRHLSIGRVAPEVEGIDLDGAPMKLSDSRGKIVLLVFWASWCGPCMAAVPHEKELVERFKGRPFVLIGVNVDETQHAAAKAVKKNEISWRSFWNGNGGSGGSIAADWNVRGIPTFYVLDQLGTIRQKYLEGERLDEPLEKLVATAEQHK
jgi:thiol-disulfide isomerase/thioredoxin/uncharacterized cupredoxin-like copper-binding protein